MVNFEKLYIKHITFGIFAKSVSFFHFFSSKTYFGAKLTKSGKYN